MPYLTPEEIPEDGDCRPLYIPLSTDWLAIVSGALTELTIPYNWEQFGAVTVEEAVAAMQSMLNRYYDGCDECLLPDGGRVIRIDSDGHLQELTDGSWVAATGDYAIPAPEAREGGTSEEQICLAAKNAVNVLFYLYEQLTEAWGAHLSGAEALTILVEALVLKVGFAFAPIVFGIATFFLAVFALLYSALEYLGADLWDSAFTQQITCFLVDCASNAAGVVTFDYECFTGKLNTLANDFLLNEVQLRLYIQIGYLFYFIGGIDGLNLAATTTEITNDDCEFCDDTWCYAWNFRVSAGNWALYPGQPGEQNECGLETGLVFAAGNPLRGRRQTIWQFLDFPTDATVLSVYGEQEVSSIGDVSANPAGVAFYQNAFANVVTTGSLSVGHNEGGMVDEGWTSIDSWQILMAVGGCDTCGDPGGDGCWAILTMTGRGTLPVEFFGGEEC